MWINCTITELLSQESFFSKSKYGSQHYWPLLDSYSSFFLFIFLHLFFKIGEAKHSCLLANNSLMLEYQAFRAIRTQIFPM